MQSSDIKKIQKAVLKWYTVHGRHDLPWRQFDLPSNQLAYQVIVSELMLQQTQVERVILKFELFLKTFPTLESLAKAPSSKVIQLWSGLGYNRRAIHLHKAVQTVIQEYEGIIPQEIESLKNLPGIGQYTAGAIGAFAFNKPVVVLDTNIQRFYELLLWGYLLPVRSEIEDTAKRFIPPTKSRTWHSALMDPMSSVRKYASPKEQQAALLGLLQLKPTWPLPALEDNRLWRARQSTFRHSRRYYRGRIIAHLGSEPTHTSNYEALGELMIAAKIPKDYKVSELLLGLKKDGLVLFEEPLSPKSKISLPI